VNAANLYERLERDFITSSMSDDWSQYMTPISDFLTDNFKQRSIGLVCDNTSEIKKVYTAVFPSNDVMKSVLDKNETQMMLFVHHPSIWDIRKEPDTFQLMDRNLLAQFKERMISIYNLHVPLDNFGEYSTSVCLGRSVGIEPSIPFYNYYGALAAVFGKTELTNTGDLHNRFETAIGHRTSLYQYGTNYIKDGLIAVAAGGGNIVGLLEEIAREGCNTFITGITVRNAHSEKAHSYAAQNGISILGGTHYSTEKPACQAMCNYFVKLGIPAEFIEDIPVFEDL